MRILVTGGAGFIGSHLVEKLIGDGERVTVVDDFSVGKMRNLPKHQNLKVIKLSVLDKKMRTFFNKIEVVYHLAALTRPQESILDPENTTKVNVLGTLKVLEACRDFKVRRLVYTSSTSLYGHQNKLPIAESAKPNPMSPYALTKLVGEQYCKLFEVMYGLESNYIRPFNVFGPRQSTKGTYAAAVPNFINHLLKNTSSNITGDGSQARDFVYVEDVVDLMILLSKTPVVGEAFNAGSGVKTSIIKLYKTIEKIIGKQLAPNYIPEVYEPKYTLGDMTKAKRLLGYKPKYDLINGLKKTIAYYSTT